MILNKKIPKNKQGDYYLRPKSMGSATSQFIRPIFYRILMFLHFKNVIKEMELEIDQNKFLS